MLNAVYKPLQTTEYFIVDFGLMQSLVSEWESTKIDPRESELRMRGFITDAYHAIEATEAEGLSLGFCSPKLQMLIDIVRDAYGFFSDMDGSTLFKYITQLKPAFPLGQAYAFADRYEDLRSAALPELQRVAQQIHRDIADDPGLVRRPVCLYFYNPRGLRKSQLVDRKKLLQSTQAHERFHAYVRLQLSKYPSSSTLEVIAFENALAKGFEEFSAQKGGLFPSEVAETFRRFSAAAHYTGPQNHAFLEEVLARLEQLEEAQRIKDPVALDFINEELKYAVVTYNNATGKRERLTSFAMLLRRIQDKFGTVRGFVDHVMKTHYQPPPSKDEIKRLADMNAPVPAYLTPWRPNDVFLISIGYKTRPAGAA